jgi:hypothetical protein
VQLAPWDSDLKLVREIVSLCGSFLTLRDDTVYFVHQSAKDFLFVKAFNHVFPEGTGCVHRAIFVKSVSILHKTLHRDMYSLQAPGCPVEDVKLPPLDLLASSHYSCLFWINHLCDSRQKTSARNSVRHGGRELHSAKIHEIPGAPGVEGGGYASTI